MMALADDLKPVLSRIRAIPGQLGLRPYSVKMLVRTYAGATVGVGGYADTETEIVEEGGYPPKVRWLSDERLSLAGYAAGTIEVGPITPSHTGGGASLETLEQSGVLTRAEVHLIVTGPEHPSGAKYRVRSLRSDHAMHYTLRAERVAD